MGKKKGKRKANERNEDTKATETQWQPEPAGESLPLQTKPGVARVKTGANFWAAKSDHGSLSLAPIAEPQTAQDSPNIQTLSLTIDHALIITNPPTLLSFLPTLPPMVPRIIWRGLEGVHQ